MSLHYASIFAHIARAQKKSFFVRAFSSKYFFLLFPCSWNSLGWMSRTEHLMEIQFWTRKMHLFFPYVVFVCLLFYYLRSKENKCWMYTLHYITYHITMKYTHAELKCWLGAIHTSILKQTTWFFSTHNIQRIRKTKHMSFLTFYCTLHLPAKVHFYSKWIPELKRRVDLKNYLSCKVCGRQDRIQIQM